MDFEQYLRQIAAQQNTTRRDDMPLLANLEAWIHVSSDAVVLTVNSRRWLVTGTQVVVLPSPIME
jgi:hypothetical protein